MWKKIWINKSTTVRENLLAPGLNWVQQQAPDVSAALIQPLFTRVRANPQPLLGQLERPSRRWTLESEGQRLMVYSWGDFTSAERPRALVAHGWNSNAWELYPIIERLRHLGYAVLSFDQVGHGLSSGRHSSFPQFARNIERVARTLPPLDLVIGHSMGGAASALAMTRGLKTAAAVLLAPPDDVRVYLERFGKWMHLQPEVTRALQKRLEIQEKVDLDQLVPEKLVRGLQVPALIVCDRGDRETGLKASQNYASQWPGARLEITEGLGHRRILSAPSVLGTIEQFVTAQQQKKTPV